MRRRKHGPKPHPGQPEKLSERTQHDEPIASAERSHAGSRVEVGVGLVDDQPSAAPGKSLPDIFKLCDSPPISVGIVRIYEHYGIDFANQFQWLIDFSHLRTCDLPGFSMIGITWRTQGDMA